MPIRKPALVGMLLTLPFRATPDPASARVVGTMPPQDVMNLVDEAQRQVEVASLSALAIEPEEVADREGVRPEVAARWSAARKAGSLGELVREVTSQLIARLGSGGHRGAISRTSGADRLSGVGLSDGVNSCAGGYSIRTYPDGGMSSRHASTPAPDWATLRRSDGTACGS